MYWLPMFNDIGRRGLHDVRLSDYFNINETFMILIFKEILLRLGTQHFGLNELGYQLPYSIYSPTHSSHVLLFFAL